LGNARRTSISEPIINPLFDDRYDVLLVFIFFFEITFSLLGLSDRNLTKLVIKYADSIAVFTARRYIKRL